MHTDFLKNELEDFVLEALERWHVPGMALAVVGGDRVLHCAGYGQRDPARGLPVTHETLFPIASCTKSFTVMALGLLVDEGKLDWDKPVRPYLPDWQMYDKVARRHQRLLRLLREAQAQGAAPSHHHLAEALGVSQRTVERDVARLGEPLPHQEQNVGLVQAGPHLAETFPRRPCARLPARGVAV